MKLVSTKNNSLQKALSILGDKWTALLIRELSEQPLSFCKLECSLQGISPRTLSQRLDMLEANKIIKRVKYCDHPPRYNYQLSRKGEDLRKVLNAMHAWGAKYD